MRILVLGATGMLGHVVAHELSPGNDILAGVRDAERARRFGIPGELYPVDARDPATAAALIEREAPDVVINAIGLVKQLDEASRPIPAITVNSLLPHVLAGAATRSGARLVHVSTDCVFSGRLAAPAAYREEDTPDPEDLYGRTKLLGEVGEAPAVTLRTSIIGRELDRASGLMEWFAGQGGATLNGFTEAIFSGLTTKALARVIAKVIADHPGLSGLYQVAAAPISKYDLLLRLRDVLGVRCEIVPVAEPRVNRALDGTRFAAETGIAIPSWDDMLDEYRSSP
jgi:dTDP-4-dehydrorhamnose reductase